MIKSFGIVQTGATINSFPDEAGNFDLRTITKPDMPGRPPFNLRQISEQFQIFGEFVDAEPFGNGHINDSYVATYDQGGARIRYLHQRINHVVFKDPPRLMENFRRVTEHICRGLHEAGICDRSRRSLSLVPTREGMFYCQEGNGNYWRTCVFIENATTFDVIESPTQAYEAARAFGIFQHQVSDLAGSRLHETIPDFHHTPKRYEALQAAIAADPLNRAATARREIQFAMDRAEICTVLLDLQAEGKIPERITHNDTKLNNVLLDITTGAGLCAIDLDTVMPGLALYDFGDLVRTATSPATEDERDLSKVYMQTDMFNALARGYLSSASDFLNPLEIELLPFSGKLISFTIGLRFLTDYLLGDKYFKIQREGQNLDRCRTQFKLVESIEEQEESCRKYIDKVLQQEPARAI